MSHIQFTRDSRVGLAILLNARKNQTECAKILGMHRVSVSNEIKYNKDEDGVYRGVHAHQRAIGRRKKAKEKFRKLAVDIELRKYVIKKIKLFWSPEQIAGRLKRIHGKTIICHETIYQFIYTERKDLIKYLRHQKNKYRRKRGTYARNAFSTSLKIRRIEERPEVVNERSRIGDWENDTVLGKEKIKRILTLVERKSGFGLGNKLDMITAEIVHNKETELFKKIPKSKRHTMTRDNGAEFGDYDRALERKTNMKVYRATPYHSWERGTNENWNGLLRQYFPKGMYFATITQVQITKAVRALNNRPRKRHNYSTPREIFNDVVIQTRT
jgi:IS30 family transposase